MKDKTRLFNGFSPKDKGCQLLSLKVRPNDKCLCGSGKKQKHCHGTDTRYQSTEPKNRPQPVEKTVPEVVVVPKPKHLLIIGPPASGKTKLANKIAAEYQENEVYYFNMHRKKNVPIFFFDNCTENTKLIIVDNIKSFTQLGLFYNLSERLEVDRPGQSTFTINPRIICISTFITEADIIFDATFNHRFEVIDLTQVN